MQRTSQIFEAFCLWLRYRGVYSLYGPGTVKRSFFAALERMIDNDDDYRVGQTIHRLKLRSDVKITESR